MRCVRSLVLLGATALGLVAAVGSGSAAPLGRATAGASPTVTCKYPPDTLGPPSSAHAPPAKAETGMPLYATLVTNQGTIVLELDAAAAPCTVNSFVSLAKQGYYDNSPCHRLIDLSARNSTFGALQCGDPTGTGRGGPGYTFADENLAGARYAKGVIAMANRGANTNGSQFFMMFKNSDFAPNYTPFGHIRFGVEVLEKIAAGGTSTTPLTPTSEVPRTKVTIEKITVSADKPSRPAQE
ncbi:MAG TPA: peptidylprolyl isomerase [Sporichthyaceae bacterium]|jgi:peptidyl-prolyl cis-trans isomerase B (cyclophilin B)|nr:peptidylprolyl isomerase [Sporichthyaceae bacterium]